jgi:4-coumarate--CoA ligase
VLLALPNSIARVRDTSPALVFATPDNVEKLSPLRVPVVLVPDAFHLVGDGAPEFAPFPELLLLDSEPLPGPSVRQDDAAAILYSSGTGGQSKGVVLTHRNLIATVELFVRFEASQYAAPACDNVYLAALPMFHVYGLSLFAVGLLSLGSMVVVMKRFNAGEAVKAIRRFKVTHFPIVPPIMAALVHTTKPAAMPLECLVQVSTGAAPSSRRLIDDFVKAFPHVDLIQVPAYPTYSHVIRSSLPCPSVCIPHWYYMLVSAGVEISGTTYKVPVWGV